MTAALLLALQAVLTVGGGGGFATVGEALAAAAPGDTVRVTAGVYREHLTISRPVVLLGAGAVLDGGGEGTILTVQAPAVIRGLTFRGTGRSQSREDAAILASEAAPLTIEDCRFEDVLFGIYVKQTPAPVVRGNVITGAELPAPLRGDGIRLWYSAGGVIEGNEVANVRDVVIWFSDSAQVRRNTIRDSRYGLHYMYSHHSVFEDNAFTGNHVGAFLMYSRDITFRRNLFADARGTTGRGLGFKDTDAVLAEDNVLAKNAVGISLDNSPQSAGVVNTFRGNLIAYNDVAVTLLPSVRSNEFLANRFLDNVRVVTVTGGGTALGNTWRDNRWSDYAGFDADGDGVGDTPWVAARLSDDLLARHDALQLFALSPAMTGLDVLSRILPLLEPQPVLIDSAPRLAGGAVAVERTALTATPPAGAALLVSGLAGLLALRHRTFRRRMP